MTSHLIWSKLNIAQMLYSSRELRVSFGVLIKLYGGELKGPRDLQSKAKPPVLRSRGFSFRGEFYFAGK
jgi:hypothetical protein